MQNKVFKRILVTVLALMMAFPMNVLADVTTNETEETSEQEVTIQEVTPEVTLEIAKISETKPEVTLEKPREDAKAQRAAHPTLLPEEQNDPEIGKSEVPKIEELAYLGWVKNAGHWFHYDKVTGMTIGWAKINEKWYFFDKEGVMQTKWQTIGDRRYYFKEGDDGSMVTGWYKDTGDNNWYYFHLGNNGSMATGWQKIDGNWFYLNEVGIMQTDWQKISGDWFYFNKSGIMQIGWQKIGDSWYCFRDGDNGRMKTGWQKMKNSWYYFAEGDNGRMQSGWQQVKGKWYYLGEKEDGKMKTGWTQVSKKWYYLNLGDDGSMVTGWFKDPGNNKWYYLKTGNDGSMLMGWLKWNEKWYYLDGDGTMVAKTSKVIDGKTQAFDANGVWTGEISGYIWRRDSAGINRELEPEFDTHPRVSDEAFFAAVVYTEAGDQGYEGALMSALAMMNRVKESPSYSYDLRFVIYSRQQFAVVRDGSLLRELTAIQKDGFEKWKANSYRKNAVNAAADATKMVDEYMRSGKPRTIPGITLPNGKKDFDYILFMTPASFDRNNLDPVACDSFIYKGHIYFKNWKRY